MTQSIINTPPPNYGPYIHIYIQYTYHIYIYIYMCVCVCVCVRVCVCVWFCVLSEYFVRCEHSPQSACELCSLYLMFRVLDMI